MIHEWERFWLLRSTGRTDCRGAVEFWVFARIPSRADAGFALRAIGLPCGISGFSFARVPVSACCE